MPSTSSNSTSCSNTIAMCGAALIALCVLLDGCGGGGSNSPALVPQAALSSGTLAFVSATAPAQTPQSVTLTNAGTGPLSISGITVSGVNASNFTQTSTCGSTLAANASCTITISFTPTSAATFAASVSIIDNAANSPQKIALTSAPPSKILPPTTGAYLGASVNPAQGAIDLETQTETLEGQIGRKLSLHMHYYGWTNGGAATFPETAAPFYMADDVANGRIPVVSWDCGHKDTDITAGTYDSEIDAEAAAIKAFGSPIILRWFWEFNNDGASTSEKAIDCLNRNNLSGNPAEQGAEFAAAWIHIWNRFTNVDGVTNVTWLWNPSGTNGTVVDYYPGNQYVDWIGDDEYGNFTTSNPNGTFDATISDFYTLFNSSTYGKPLLIGETGGCPTVQDTYINSAANDLPTKYSSFRAFIYWDSVGTSTGCPSSSTPLWTFTPAGQAAFASMGALPYFSPIP